MLTRRSFYEIALRLLLALVPLAISVVIPAVTSGIIFVSSLCLALLALSVPSQISTMRT